MKNIFFVGFMGAGKSTVARNLQKRLKMNLVEMDERIEKEQGMTIPEIFEKYGESRFRNLESELILTIGKEGNTIVSCGGGVVVRPENIEYMKKNGMVIFLSAKPETVFDRVKDSTNRPILNGNMNVEYIGELMEKRRALYEAAADVKISTDGKSIDEITDEVIIAI
ncbi:MAG: shikimate kinase [Lachnospiraceae bacterium]|nr:shikimate kinase [Lachnospiraceae bacterium]